MGGSWGGGAELEISSALPVYAGVVCIIYHNKLFSFSYTNVIISGSSFKTICPEMQCNYHTDKMGRCEISLNVELLLLAREWVHEKAAERSAAFLDHSAKSFCQ